MSTHLEHRIRVRLAKLELTKSAVRRLAHQKMLAGREHVAEAALQRVGIEESTPTRCLERNRGHTLRYLGDIGGRGACLSLLLRRWHSTRARLIPDAGQDLQRERMSGGELQLGLPKCKLKVWVCRQRRGLKVAPFPDRLPGYFIQARRAMPRAIPMWKGATTAGKPRRSAAPPATSLPSTASIKGNVISSGTNTFSML